MTHRGEVRRKDRQMANEEAWAFLERGYIGHLATCDSEGWPYVVPVCYLVRDGRIYFHQTAHMGHTATNLQGNPRVCFEVDKPGRVFPSGAQSACYTSIEYQSVVAFGECRRVDDVEMKKDILRELVARYADPAWERPEDWTLLDATAVYEITVETLTSKRRPLAVAERWRDSLGLGAKEIQERR